MIPGHGGVSDRMDCQMIMGGFTYFYLNAFLNQGLSTIQIWIDQLNADQQLLIY